MTTWKRKVEEYEAELYSIPKSGWARLFLRSKGGEIEVKRYDDGEKRMEIDLRRVKCPDGALVAVVINGRQVRQVETRSGFARLHLSSLDGEALPEVCSGDKVEIQLMGEVLLEGVFMPD